MAAENPKFYQNQVEGNRKCVHGAWVAENPKFYRNQVGGNGKSVFMGPERPKIIKLIRMFTTSEKVSGEPCKQGPKKLQQI